MTASTKNKQLFFLHKSPIPSRGCNTPVDVSAWTIANITGFLVSISYFISSKVNASPHSFSITDTSALYLDAISTKRSPKYPFFAIRIFSPGSIKLAIDASIAALPVPLIGRVIRLLHCHVYLSNFCTSDINSIYASSKCPIGLSAKALRTSG